MILLDARNSPGRVPRHGPRRPRSRGGLLRVAAPPGPCWFPPPPRPSASCSTSRCRKPAPISTRCSTRCDDVIARFSRHNAHPRFFGYVSSPGTPVTALGSMLAAALNVNVTCWRSAPAGTELERLTINWLKEMLGYPPEAVGLFASGGSMANFAALAAARSAKAPANVVRDGVAAAGKRMCVYVSREGHFSIGKAAGMLGIGEAQRPRREDRRPPADRSGRPGTAGGAGSRRRAPSVLRSGQRGHHGHRRLRPDRRAGRFRAALRSLAACGRGLRWIRRAGSLGAPLVRGIAEADSVALDPHKWLYLPVGCGCVLYKDPAAARAAFSHERRLHAD